VMLAQTPAAKGAASHGPPWPPRSAAAAQCAGVLADAGGLNKITSPPPPAAVEPV